MKKNLFLFVLVLALLVAGTAASAATTAHDALVNGDIVYAAGETYLLYASGNKKALYNGEINISASSTNALYVESANTLYFVTAEEPTVLYGYNTSRNEIQKQAQADADITALRLSMDGLLVTAGDTEYLYVPAAKLLAVPTFSAQGAEISSGNGFDALLSADGKLCIRLSGSETPYEIAQNVLVADAQGDAVFFIGQTGDPYMLYSYVVPTQKLSVHAIYLDNMRPLLLAADDKVYAITENGAVYAYDTAKNAIEKIADTASTDAAVTLHIWNNTLYVLFDGDIALEQPLTQKEEIVVAPVEEVVPVTLSRGMKNDDVKELQTLLKKYGYPVGSVDGDFGANTEKSIKLLQSQMGLTETGKATPSLMDKLRSGKVETYEEYIDLDFGDEGIRVQMMQERLRELGYMTENAGGHYQKKTKEAVKRFQQQLEYKANGDITEKQLKKLMSDKCPSCEIYYELSKGESSPMIQRLNKRLKKLGYFSGSTGEEYTSNTTKAVKLFTEFNSLETESKTCSADLQEAIYADDAQHYVDPEGPELSLPTQKELKVIRNYIRNFRDMDEMENEDCVRYLQQKLVDLGYLAAEYVTGTYGTETSEAVYNVQVNCLGKYNGRGIAGKRTLEYLFPIDD